MIVMIIFGARLAQTARSYPIIILICTTEHVDTISVVLVDSIDVAFDIEGVINEFFFDTGHPTAISQCIKRTLRLDRVEIYGSSRAIRVSIGLNSSVLGVVLDSDESDMMSQLILTVRLRVRCSVTQVETVNIDWSAHHSKRPESIRHLLLLFFW